MISIADVAAARKAILRVCEGDIHYSFILDQFVDNVEKEINRREAHVPALLRRTSSESV